MFRVTSKARGGLIAVLASAAIVTFAAPGTAYAAADAGPSAALSFAAASVSSGTQPAVTFVTAGLPAGSIIYLQRESGAGQTWQSIGRATADAGTVQLPAEPAGSYWYRILVARGGTTIVTSAPASLTVTGAQGAATNSGCSSCGVASTVLRWLVPIVEPILAPIVQQFGSAVLSFLGALFGV